MCKKTDYEKSNPKVDKCMRTFIKTLNKIIPGRVVASCCGHYKYKMSVIVIDKWGSNIELFSGKIIPRKRRFYQRDKDGYFYVPEVNQSKEIICECGHKQWEEHKSSFYNYKGLKTTAQECNVKGCRCKKFKKGYQR